MGCACGKDFVDINHKKYIVRSRLGEGYVDLLEDISNHKLYAGKRILVHSEEDLMKAQKEIQYCKSIDHPNVIKCIDWVTMDANFNKNLPEVIMLLPFYQHGTLQNALEKRAKLNKSYSQHEALKLFLSICEGVKALHDSKPDPIAHRDLKPGNILFDDEFNPVVMDLGSAGPARQEIRTSLDAKQLEDMAAQNCSMLYRAPELFHVERDSFIDERTDIWSLGCMLYAICYFKSPFEIAYERGGSIALAVVSGSINIPSTSPYSQHVHDLILSMLSVNFLERPFIDSVLFEVTKLLSSSTSAEC